MLQSNQTGADFDPTSVSPIFITRVNVFNRANSLAAIKTDAGIVFENCPACNMSAL